MSAEVMAIVLFGAALHAAWNALVRSSTSKFDITSLIVMGAAVWTALLLPWLPLPRQESWPFLGASAVVHVLYFSLLALAYREAELSFIYPLMRGAAPAMAAVAAASMLGESPSAGGWLGVTLISLGGVALLRDSWRGGAVQPTSLALALGVAVLIVAYTLIDGQGARLSGHAFSYTGWMFLLTAVGMGVVWMIHQERRLLVAARQEWRLALIGGACTLASYGLALWAMTRAPIALVAALRETSVVFAALIGVVLLGERVSRAKITAVGIICAGAVALKIF